MNAIESFYISVKSFLAEASETLGVGINAGMETWKTELAYANHSSHDDDDNEVPIYSYKQAASLRCENTGIYCNKCNQKCYAGGKCTWCD